MHVLFLHGFANGPGQWARTLADLPLAWHTHCLTLPGHGSEPPAATTWTANLARVGEAIAHLPRPLHVVGYSLGARVALGLLAEARVDAALLIGVNPGLQDATARQQRAALDEKWASLLEQQGVCAFTEAWLAQPLFATQQRFAIRLAERVRARGSNTASGLASAMRGLGLAAMPAYHEVIAAHAPRLALVTGALDAKFSQIAHTLVAASPALTAIRLADSGHDPTLEAPSALAECIQQWVTHCKAHG